MDRDEKEDFQPWNDIKKLIDVDRPHHNLNLRLIWMLIWKPQATFILDWNSMGQKTIVLGKKAQDAEDSEDSKWSDEDAESKQRRSERRRWRVEFLIYRLGLLKETLQNNKLKLESRDTSPISTKSTDSHADLPFPPIEDKATTFSITCELSGHA